MQNTYAQYNLDSMLRIVKTAKDDTNKIHTYVEIATEFSYQNPDSSLFYANKAKKLADMLHNTPLSGRASYEMAWAWYQKSNYAKAQEIAYDLLKTAEKLRSNTLTMSATNLLAIIYEELGANEKALHYHHRTLEISKRSKYGDGVAASYGNIAVVYSNMGNYSKSLEYSFKSIAKYKKLNSLRGIASKYSNLAYVYKAQGDSAISAGNTKFAMEVKFPLAVKYALEGIRLSKQIENESGIMSNMIQLSDAYEKMGQLQKAEEYAINALEYARHFNSASAFLDAHHILSRVYEQQGKYNLALEHYNAHLAARDSLNNEENSKKQTRIEMQYEFDKKRAAIHVKNTEKIKRIKLQHDQQIARQKVWTLAGLIGFILMLLTAIISIRAFRQKKNDNLLIAKQKLLVELKQREIIDSIHYASRIQKALLPSKGYIANGLRKTNQSKLP